MSCSHFRHQYSVLQYASPALRGLPCSSCKAAMMTFSIKPGGHLKGGCYAFQISHLCFTRKSHAALKAARATKQAQDSCSLIQLVSLALVRCGASMMLLLRYLRIVSGRHGGGFYEVNCKGWITGIIEAPQQRGEKPLRQIHHFLKSNRLVEASGSNNPAGSRGCPGTSQHMAKVQFQHH